MSFLVLPDTLTYEDYASSDEMNKESFPHYFVSKKPPSKTDELDVNPPRLETQYPACGRAPRSG